MWKKWIGGLVVAAGGVVHFLGLPQIGDLLMSLGAAIGAVTIHHQVAASSSSSSSSSSGSSSGGTPSTSASPSSKSSGTSSAKKAGS